MLKFQETTGVAGVQGCTRKLAIPDDRMAEQVPQTAEVTGVPPIDEERQSPNEDSSNLRNLLHVPSTPSLLGSASTSGGPRSNLARSQSGSLTPASTRSNQSCVTRTSWAAGQVQEASPMASPRLVAELPAATPRVTIPLRLWLVAPERPSLQGAYARLPDIVANGEAIWRQLSGDGWLFSCTSGFWMVADHRDKVERNLAQLRTVDRHYEKLPHECTRWMYGDDSRQWTADASSLVLLTPDRECAEHRIRQQEQRVLAREAQACRRAACAPGALWLAAPPRPFLQGEYCKVQGRLERGQPVWRQVGGEGWMLASASGDHWIIATEEPGAQAGMPQIRSSVSHGGKWPHEVEGWKYANGNGGWATDYVRAIRVSTNDRIAVSAQANYTYCEDVESPCKPVEHAEI